MARPQISILIVEDDEDTRLLLTDLLSADGARTVTAVDCGADALAFLDTTYPDLVVLNMVLPDTDGVALYHVVRQRTGLASVPVLFLSALSAEQIAQRLYDLDGRFTWIAKPFDIDVLDATIDDLLL